jgi:hypothetical protein
LVIAPPNPVIVVIDCVPDDTCVFPPAVGVPLFDVPPAPPPTTVTLTAVTPDGIVKVPEEVKTVALIPRIAAVLCVVLSLKRISVFLIDTGIIFSPCYLLFL